MLIMRNDYVFYTFAQKAGLCRWHIASSLLTAYAYIANATTQTPEVQNLFFAEIVTIPLIIFIVLFFLFLYLNKFEKKIPQMRKEIEERELIAAASATSKNKLGISSNDVDTANINQPDIEKITEEL